MERTRKDSSDIRMGHFGWPWLHNEHHEQNISPQMSSSTSNTEAPGSWSSSCSASTSGNTDDHYINIFDVDINNLDVEISWNDLMIREQIGQGSCGTAYCALLYGSDVAVKVFTKLQYPGDVILSFRNERVEFVHQSRSPGFLFFYRGSLFQLLRQNTAKLDWRRQVHIAMDIAHGMNYLHHFQPPIVHRDLKSSNVLVDKNWTVKFSYESDTKSLIMICLQLNKVGDFGLSRVKRETYLTTKSGRGTLQFFGIFKTLLSDVYSYGVVLWEINTRKIPWDDLNSMQVIGAVGFMNQRLEIPNDVNPEWASLIESCLSSEPQFRPTFQEILSMLRDLMKKLTILHRDKKS
ncbi:hypothetical protein CTI12_AA580190 [Artemisia annua]|uniref:Protein kinase domain-containing protein n=1 Tax=Artemisia annua TaxID=35608 RepID=A0A2U1KPB2_ARTAN|nr:hypothetical protein CTI12_AA580190 [Artemisia annua]